MDFRMWLVESEGVIHVPLSKLVLTKSELQAAVENITRGYPAMTEGPVLVVDMGRGLYQLVNGYHRLIPMMLSGADSVLALVDVSAGKRPWGLPTRSDRFRYDPSLPYKGLETFLEPYMLRRLG
jgi:hypothetical protein